MLSTVSGEYYSMLFCRIRATLEDERLRAQSLRYIEIGVITTLVPVCLMLLFFVVSKFLHHLS